MSKREAILAVVAFYMLLVFGSMASAQQLPPSVGPQPQSNNFSGILREDGGYVLAFFKSDMVGRTILLCNRVMDGGYCTQPYHITQESLWGNAGGMGIAVISDYWNQSVYLYEMRNGSINQELAISLDQGSNPGLVVAAYEQQIATSGPIGPATTTALKIAGRFDPNAPATIFAGWEPVRIQPVSSTQSGSTRESVILLDNSLVEKLPPSYPLTICQYGLCQTVTVKHIPTPSSGGRG